jgi:hypothetical protein
MRIGTRACEGAVRTAAVVVVVVVLERRAGGPLTACTAAGLAGWWGAPPDPPHPATSSAPRKVPTQPARMASARYPRVRIDAPFTVR